MVYILGQIDVCQRFMSKSSVFYGKKAFFFVKGNLPYNGAVRGLRLRSGPLG